MLRIIRELRPRYIVGENVGGIVSWDGGLVFEQVQTEMEAEGYEVQAFVLPACAVNAPHRRDRVWFVAHRFNERHEQQHADSGRTNCAEQASRGKQLGQKRTTPNARHPKPQGRDEAQDGQQHGGRRNPRRKFAPFGSGCIAADTTGDRWKRKGKGFENEKGLQSKPQSAGKLERGLERPRSEWNLTDWTRFPTQPPVCSANDGFSAGLAGITVSRHRRESIKAYGNAIVPQVAVQIFKAIIEAEKSMNP